MADSKISALTSGGLVQAGDNLVVARAGSSLKVTPAGIPVLVYRYTVTGSDKATIDTGVDTADAGSNDWTNGDLLEVLFYARTDEAVVGSQINLTFNNDATSIYDILRLQAVNTTVNGAASNARANWFCLVAGASATASIFGMMQIVIPNFAGTVGFKAGQLTAHSPDETAANMSTQMFACNYRSTSALVRLAITPNTALKKFKVGSQLLIYKRLAS